MYVRGEGMNLLPKHFKAVQLLYEQVPDTVIAKECGISVATLNKWKQDSDFKRALVEVATSQMGDLVPLAIGRLRELLTSEACQGNVRIAAIKEVLNYAQLSERKDLEAEVTIKVEYV